MFYLVLNGCVSGQNRNFCLKAVLFIFSQTRAIDMISSFPFLYICDVYICISMIVWYKGIYVYMNGRVPECDGPKLVLGINLAQASTLLLGGKPLCHV